MRRWYGAAAFVAVIATALPAAADDVPNAEAVVPANPGTLDRDLAHSLDAAEKTDDPDQAMKLVLPIFAAPNRFTVAQKALLAPRSASLLRRVGGQSVARGQVELGLRAYDAAWQIDHEADPAYGAALILAADKERAADPDAALWMARRARVVAPTFEPARDRDERWSNNRLAPYGYGLMITGLVTVAAGVVCTVLSNAAKTDLTSGTHDRAQVDDLVGTQRSFGLAAGVAFGAGAVTFASGIALVLLGNPKESPRSPSYLPALREASR